MTDLIYENWKKYTLINFPVGKDFIIKDEIFFLPKKEKVIKSYLEMQSSSCMDLNNAIKLLNSPPQS